MGWVGLPMSIFVFSLCIVLHFSLPHLVADKSPTATQHWQQPCLKWHAFPPQLNNGNGQGWWTKETSQDMKRQWTHYNDSYKIHVVHFGCSSHTGQITTRWNDLSRIEAKTAKLHSSWHWIFMMYNGKWGCEGSKVTSNRQARQQQQQQPPPLASHMTAQAFLATRQKQQKLSLGSTLVPFSWWTRSLGTKKPDQYILMGIVEVYTLPQREYPEFKSWHLVAKGIYD